jgi:hypothetical protein
VDERAARAAKFQQQNFTQLISAWRPLILTHGEKPEDVDRWIENAEKELNTMEKHHRNQVCLSAFEIASALTPARSITRSGRERLGIRNASDDSNRLESVRMYDQSLLSNKQQRFRRWYTRMGL